MTNKNLVLLSYGRESEYYRTIFCVLSFFAWTPRHKIDDVNVLIYTDNPFFFQEYFKDLKVEYVTLTETILMEMMGDTDYIHRRKVGVIDLTFKAFPERDLLFVDSDTFFIHETDEMLDGFAENKSFMHKREYNFEEGLALFSSFGQGQYPEAFINYITDREFVIGGSSERFSKYDYCWNSGVLGLDKSFASYLPDIFKLVDEFYNNSHWFISEQLAFALVLQKRTEIRPTDKFLLHYWGARQKVLVDGLLKELFDRTSPANFNDISFIRSVTKNWKNKIELDLVLEQAVMAFSLGHLKYGLKKSVQVFLHFPTDVKVYKELFCGIKRGSNKS
ncbi:hypothetical protein [Pedobacter nyackensis]|uniref:hypothetical protein n=1 Tax=Pedobacter nyackensis TaxID=475255 RepID=UPI00292FCCA2|nr:hypothetical protein [Pedobacter nyackensis]